MPIPRKIRYRNHGEQVAREADMYYGPSEPETMELPKITDWQARGSGSYRIFGDGFWADVTLQLEPEGWKAQIVAGNYTGRLDGLAEAAIGAINGVSR